MLYFDHAATSPMRPEAIDAMVAAFGVVGNASSVHTAGRSARRLLEESREAIAHCLGAHPTEVLFTSGGTEADNLAVKGIYRARRAAENRRRRILISAIEHSAVRNSARALITSDGAEVEELAMDSTGLLDPETLRAAIARDPETVALVSVMWANNEIGTLQPIDQLARIARDFAVPFHTDAVQAVGHVPISFAACGAHALSLTAHKFGGPVGIGALLVRRELEVTPLLHGGGHERDVRSGTYNPAGAASMAAALTAACAGLDEAAIELGRLRNLFVGRVLEVVPDAQLNGPALDGPRHPGNASISFPGCAGDALLLLLDQRGVACSAASACSAGVVRPSRVILAIGVPPDLALGTVRFSLGHTTTEAEVEELAGLIGEVVAAARIASGGQASN